MALIVLFSFILLASTHSVAIGASTFPNMCIVKMSSTYSRESKYCSSVFDSKQNEDKANVCNEILQLFEKICLLNRPDRPFPLPEPQNVSIENCVLLCADIELQYISSMVDSSNASCKTLCTMDPEAVAVLLTLFQLKDLIADLEKKGEQKVATATYLTSQLQKRTVASEVTTAESKVPDVESTTIDLKPTGEHMGANVTDSTSEQLQQLTSPSNAAGNNNSAPKEEDVKTASTAARRTSPSPTELDVNSTNTGEKKTLPAKTDVRQTTTAAGENYSRPKEPDVTTTTTAQKGKSLSPRKLYSKTTTAERTPAPTGIDVTQTTTETEDVYNANEGLDFESENTNEEADGLNKNDNEKSKNEDKLGEDVETNGDPDERPLPGDRPSKTGEKDETSKLDDTPSSYHFLIYFLAFIVLCVAAYIVFHNKHKIIAFIIEGKQGRRGGRPSTKQYTPLKSKVEDVMPFVEKSTTQSNYIY